MGNSVRIAQNASNLAEAHAELGNLAEAQQYAEIVLNEQAPQSHPYALYTLGTVAWLRREYQQAAHYYEQSRQIAEANDDAYLQAFAWRALATVHHALQEYATARQALAQARVLFEQLGIAEEVRETDRLAAEHDA
jgi:tetratricopeptide (TPR) repeat protein